MQPFDFLQIQNLLAFEVVARRLQLIEAAFEMSTSGAPDFSSAEGRLADAALSAMQATLQRESIERSKLAASLSASHRQLETAQAALQSKELTIAKMRSRIGSSNTTGALAQDMARLGYTLGLKST
mgnify:CR=1 FL=1